VGEKNRFRGGDDVSGDLATLRDFGCVSGYGDKRCAKIRAPVSLKEGSPRKRGKKCCSRPGNGSKAKVFETFCKPVPPLRQKGGYRPSLFSLLF
jgi:hypothetical protein